MDDTWFEVDELSAPTRASVPDASIKATYTAGPSWLEQSGVPATLWIGIYNSSLNGGPLAPMQAAAADVAALGLTWLHEHDLANPGTTIDIAFADGSQGVIFSWSNTLETIRFVIGDDGAMTRIESALSEDAERIFRTMRYRMSGRKLES